MTRQAFDPWARKIPHAVEQLSPWATATEPVLQSLGAATAETRAASLTPKRPRAPTLQRDATAVRSPHTTGRE